MTEPPSGARADATERLLSWGKVRELTGLSRTTAWRLQKAGGFPRPVAISPRRVAWRETEIRAWQASLDGRPPLESWSRRGTPVDQTDASQRL